MMRSVTVADKRRHSGTFYDVDDSEDKQPMCGSPTKSLLISSLFRIIVCSMCNVLN